ncbi:MAG: hypothetical protein FWF49_02300, partial [Oscillospiraceae bacterium]|nr:hypothetical protein [Oscillospiraceae bacterium]
MTAQTIFDEYRAGQQFKRSLGQRGLYEQARMNERFYVGDQWHGVPAPAERPLVRHNIIKRIGDYKMAMLTSASITMLFSAEGLPAPLHVKENLFGLRRQLAAGGATRALSGDEETALVMDALTDYYRSTAVRVGFDALSERALRGAFLSGTGVLYTYWDETAQTGLYADAGHTMPIQGDIQCEVLDIENVTFGDPQCTELQDQPFVILSQHKSVDEVRTLAKRYGARAMLLAALQPDRDSLLPVADPGQAKTTLLTKLYKKDG